MIPSRQRDVAGHVLGYVHAAAFFTTLQVLDQRILGLRLAGYRWSEVTRAIPLNPRALHARRHALRSDARRHWDLEPSDPYSGAGACSIPSLPRGTRRPTDTGGDPEATDV